MEIDINGEKIKIHNARGFDLKSALKEIEQLKEKKEIYDLLGDLLILIEEELKGTKKPILNELIKKKTKRIIEFTVDSNNIVIATDSLYDDTEEDILIYIVDEEMKIISTENALLLAKALIYYNIIGGW